MTPRTSRTGPPPESPSRSPRVERLAELGRGATSRVFLARLVEPFGGEPAGATLALKQLLPELADDPRALAAFEEEAAALTECSHTSLVRLTFAGELVPEGESEPSEVLLLEYVPGEPLSALQGDPEPLLEDDVRSLGVQLAGALAELHAHDRIHGDFKPDNVRVGPDGRAVLLDLGFSRRVTHADGRTPGTVAYLAPEVALGGAPDTPADVFALGIVLHQLATGHHPLRPDLARDDEDEVERHLARLGRLAQEPAPPASRPAPGISPFLEALLGEVLEADPALRPTAKDVARRLESGERGSWWRALVSRPEPRRGRDPARYPYGREVELEELSRAYEEVRGGRAASGGAVWIAGPAGSGKTRLMEEFARRARRTKLPPVLLGARASERRESRPLGTLVYLLRRWLGVPSGALPGPRARRRMETTVAPRDAELLLDALGPSVDDAPSALPAALESWVRALADTAPVVLFVDDAHLAGEATLGWLDGLARELGEARVLLVVGLRDDEDPAAPAALERLRRRVSAPEEGEPEVPFRDLVLGPIDERAVGELVDDRFAPSAPRLRITRLLHERCYGNPGLLGEILRDLRESGHARARSPRDPRLVLTVPPNALPAPPSVERAIEARFERLELDEQEWLARMAVVGGRFDSELLARTFAPDDPDARRRIDSYLARFAERGWLTPVAGMYRFERPSLSETIYEYIDEGARAAMHVAVSDRLEERGGLSWDDVYHRAHHLHRAGRRGELLDLLVPLLERMPESGQPRRTLALARWALAAGESPDGEERLGTTEMRLSIFEAAFDAANRLGRRDDEREFLDRMAALAVDPDVAPVIAARVYLAHGRHAAVTGQFGLARGWLTHAAAFAEKANDRDVASDARRRLALVHALTGELGSARELARAALDSADDRRRRAYALLARAQVDVLENRIDDALEAIDGTREQLADLPEDAIAGALATVDMLSARVLRCAGRQSRALASALRAVRRAERSGDRRLEVESRARLGGLFIDLDRFDDAETHLRDAAALAREIEDRGGGAIAGMWLGILLWERNDPAASRTIERAVEDAGDLNLFRLEAVGLAVRGRQLRAEGRLEEAVRACDRAAQRVERYGAELTDRVVITGTQASVLETAGDSGRARTLARELRRRIRTETRALGDPDLRRSQRRYAMRLLASVLDPEGPMYPRVPAPADGAGR